MTPREPSATAGPEPIRFPDDTVDLVDDLVPAIRRLLGRGLSEEFQRSCVRIGAFRSFGGGLKSSLVGGLRIDVNAVLKLGGPDLALHQALMTAANRVRPRTFPVVLDRIEIDPARQFLLMEDLRKYVTLLDLVYRDGVPLRVLDVLVDRTLEGLRAVGEAGRRHADELARIPRRPEPFLERLREKLEAVWRVDAPLSVMRRQPGRVMGLACPPLDSLLAAAGDFLRRNAASVTPVLQHGDPHLGNVMIRSYGHGWSVRLIDPNPEIGFADPLYDAGKLLHWAEPVGWAHVNPDGCRATWRTSRHGWTLDAGHVPTNAAAEQRRSRLEHLLATAVLRHMPDDALPTARTRLPLAIASAHIGLAALLRREDQQSARRFALAHTLRQLASWHATSLLPAP